MRVAKSGPTPTNPADEDVRSNPTVILNWSYERIIYNRPITPEPLIASKNTKGSIFYFDSSNAIVQK